MLAVDSGNTPVVELLLHNKAIVYPDVLLHASVQLMREDLVEKLLTLSPTPVDQKVVLLVLREILLTSTPLWIIERSTIEKSEHNIAKSLLLYTTDLSGRLQKKQDGAFILMKMDLCQLHLICQVAKSPTCLTLH